MSSSCCRSCVMRRWEDLGVPAGVPATAPATSGLPSTLPGVPAEVPAPAPTASGLRMATPGLLPAAASENAEKSSQFPVAASGRHPSCGKVPEGSSGATPRLGVPGGVFPWVWRGVPRGEGPAARLGLGEGEAQRDFGLLSRAELRL